MNTNFSLCMYESAEAMYKDEVRVYRSIAQAALWRLAELEEVELDDDGEWYWRSSGDYVGE